MHFLKKLVERYCCTELNFEKNFSSDHFSSSYGFLKIANLANLGQLTRDIFRANNAYATT